MHRFTYSLLTAALLGLLSGCRDSFIDLVPPSSPSVPQLYQTDADFRGALTGVYDGFQGPYLNYWNFGELRSDNTDHRWTAFEQQQRIDQFRTENNDGILNTTWSQYYVIITRANLLLERIAGANATAVPNKVRYEAEAKFLRALAYFDLVRIWGAVPLLTQPLSIQQAYQSQRTPVEQVYAAIVKDLQEAEPALPARFTGADAGRATQGAARSLLGKVYVYQKDWTRAEAKLKEVVDAGTYQLLANFNDVFSAANERHAEYIFDIEYEEGVGEGSDFPTRFIPNHAPLRATYGLAGTSGETNSPTDELIALFTPTDRRRAITIQTTYMDGTAERRANHPYTLKFMAPMRAAGDSRVNWKVIRFADVVLLYAEALNEAGKPAQALVELNKIRRRAGVAEYSALAQAQTRDAIELERRLELAVEGHRWFDLVRTGKALTTMTAKNYRMQAHHVLFNVPQQQIDVVGNKSVFDQNPGY